MPQSPERTFPVYSWHREGRRPNWPISIPWTLAESVYDGYVAKFGDHAVPLEDIARLGGFSVSEIEDYCPNWMKQLENYSFDDP